MNSKGSSVFVDGDFPDNYLPPARSRATFEPSIDDESNRAPPLPEIIAASSEDEAEKNETIQDSVSALELEQKVNLPLIGGQVHQEEM